MDGRILEVSKLNFKCNHCDRLATFKVRTSPQDSITTRIHFFCPDHVPARVLDGWLNEGGQIETNQEGT